MQMPMLIRRNSRNDNARIGDDNDNIERMRKTLPFIIRKDSFEADGCCRIDRQKTQKNCLFNAISCLKACLDMIAA